jgi:glycosyltransferase involved in cell wall biosynthesis
MKLLYVENSLAIHGGVERVLTDKLNWLVENGGCEVCLITANQGENPIVFPLNPKVQCHDLGIMFHRVYRYKGWRRYHQMFQLHKLFRQRMAEIVSAFSPDVIVCTRLDVVPDVIKVRKGAPVVYESHSSFSSYKYERYSWTQILHVKYCYRSLKKTQMIIALTQGDALEWKKINPHVHIIPNYVHLNDTGRYSDCCSKSAIFVGRYSYQKDLQSLLRIWKLVNQRHSDWQLHLFGGYGDQKEEILSDIRKQGTNIVMHQPTTSIYEEYLNCSMLLMTSRFEPFGLVLPEAMSCGLPVVAFDCPYGPAEIISDGIDGFLIKKHSIEEYVEKVCLLMEDENLMRKMGQAGVNSSRRYSASHVMPLWIKLFSEIIL